MTWAILHRDSQTAFVKTKTINEGKTYKFIYPPYKFKMCDQFITNFHQPKSTLMMLVAAFAKKDFLLNAYKVAKKKKYRFYSYGDSMMVI